MLRIVFIKIILIVCANIALAQDKVQVRDLFYRASKSYTSADTLFKNFKNVSTNQDAFMIAYKGMSQLMVCYHSYNPYSKFKYFLKGKESLEQAILKDPNNVEYRFLRLSVQLNTPEFLGYNSNIDEDKLVIFNGVKYLSDKDLLKRISDYTSNAKRISEKEKQHVKTALNQNKNFTF